MDFESKFDRRTLTLSPTLDELNAALAPWLGARRLASARPLSGGFSNTNHVVTLDGLTETFVVRTTTRPRENVQTEIDVISQVAGSVPTPAVCFATLAPQAGDPSYVVLAHAAGVPLHQSEDTMTARELSRVGHQLGEILAALHQHVLPGPGLLGPELAIAVPFENFADAILDETTRCFARAATLGRLDEETSERAIAFVHQHSGTLQAIRPVARLVHADFNQKNLLVAQDGDGWHVSALLDWEFAFAGAPIVDFGNFFRYEPELAAAYREPLIASYRSCGGELAPEWRLQARIVDMVNIAQFLACDAERPKTFATGRRVLENALTGQAH